MKMNQKTIITLLVVGGIAYYIWDRKKKGKSLNPFSSFAGRMDSVFQFAGKQDSEFYNATGAPSPSKKTKQISLYTAGGYDSTHMNGDGTRGATWIGYNNDRTQGYWVKGFVKQGTAM